MIDTSALVAVLRGEQGHANIRRVLEEEVCRIPSPVVLEFAAVMTGNRIPRRDVSRRFIDRLLQEDHVQVAEFGMEDAEMTRTAMQLFGKGRGNRAQLNVVDLMVYGIARRLQSPILHRSRFRPNRYRDPPGLAAQLIK